MASKVPRLDAIKHGKQNKSENLRSQIVDLANKSSSLEGRKQNNPYRTLKDNGSPNPRRSDTSLGFNDDKRQSSGHSVLHRKKETINLHFTSIKKDTRDENRPLHVLKREEIPIKEKPSTVLLNRRKSKVGCLKDPKGTITHEEVRNLHGKNEEYHTYRWSPSRQKEAATLANSARLRQSSSSVLDHTPVSDFKHSDDRKTRPDRSQMKSRNATPSINDTMPKCEIRGNAVPTPPQYSNSSYMLSSKRAGLFTASLAAFKRRLRLSSKKFTVRLQDDSSTKDDEYIITVDNANMETDESDVTKKPLYPIEDHPFIKSRKLVLPARDQQTSEGTRAPMFPSTGKGKEALVKYGGGGKSMTDTSNTGDEDNANEEDRHRQGEKHEIVQINPHEQLPSVTKAKTYVLETDQEAMVKSEFSQPIPLTTHNLKLHESLLSMRARRARRLERVRCANRNTSNLEESSLMDIANPTTRIQKWLQNVAIPEKVEKKSAEIESAQEILLMQPCAAQTGLDLHQSHKTMIYV